jgi:hypothetical protein
MEKSETMSHIDGSAGSQAVLDLVQNVPEHANTWSSIGLAHHHVQELEDNTHSPAQAPIDL